MTDTTNPQISFEMLDNIPSGLAVLGPGMEVVYWNTTLESWTHIKRGEIVGKSLLDFYPNLKAPRYINRIEQVLSGGTPAIFSSQIHKALLPCSLPGGGEQVQHVVVTGMKRTDDAGGFWALMTVQDVTALSYSILSYRETRQQLLGEIDERKAAEVARDESQDRLALVLESADIGLWDWNLTTNDVFINDEIRTMLGYDPGVSLTDHDWFVSHIHPDDVPQLQHALDNHIDDGEKLYSVEFRMRTAEQAWRWILSKGRITERDAAGTPLRMVGIHVDIHERKKSHETLVHSERLAAVGTLAAGIAHNFNNLNAGILGHLELLSRQQELPPKGRKRIELILNTVKRAVSLTDNLMLFTGKRRGQREKTSLTELIQDTLSLVRNEFESDGIDFSFEATNIPMTEMDAGAISHVLLNLLVNARHAMIGCKKKQLLIKSGVDGEGVYFSVQDSGCGIPQDKQDHIFLPFYSTKGENAEMDSPLAEVRGSGLGLSVSNTIVETHHGRFTVNSHVGEGACFTVWLPITETHKSDTEKFSRSYPLGTQLTKVLIVDDEETVRSFIGETVERLGAESVSVDSVDNALAALREQRFSHLIVDLQMPRKGGRELLTALGRFSQPPVPIIITGKMLGEDEVAAFKDQGVMDVVYKPFTTLQIMHAFMKCITHK